MGYKMTLNKNYVLYTNSNTLVPGGAKVRVTGILNYEEAQKTTSNIRDIAINENVITQVEGKPTDFDTYFKDKSFYKCHFLNDDIEVLDEYILVWDDIIRSDTYFMDHSYGFSATLTVKSNSNGAPIFNMEALLADISNFLSKKGVDFKVTNFVGDENTYVSNMENLIEKSTKTLNRLATLNTIVPIMERIATDDFATKIDNMVQSVNTMEARVNTIAAGI